MPNPAPSFDEIRALTQSLPANDVAAAQATRAQIDRIAAVEGAVGPLATLAAWLAAAQRRSDPRIAHPRIALYAATHGLAADLPDGGAETLGARIGMLTEGNGLLHRLAGAADADLRLYELDIAQPSADSRLGPAMDEAGAARAIAYGMMAVEPGVDLLVVAGLGVGADLAADALGRSLFGRSADPLAALAALGGPDIAAMLGAILAARLAGVPVILDGAAALAAGAVAACLTTGGSDHCAAAAPTGRRDFGIGVVLSFPIDAPFAGATALSLVKAAALLLR